MVDFTVGERDFQADGRPVRLLSGALHYFRVHEAQWGHRLAMLRAMGLNCVETYVPWNLHEPQPGRFHDAHALGRFLDAAHEAGLWAIVRPGPYICAEWENGGLPHWLTGALRTRVRTRDAEYLGHVERWFGRLLPQVVQRQLGRGGPVIMVQVENEYGSYGSDQVYLRHLTGLLRELGVTVPLFTSDGPEDHMLTGGSVPGVLATANFGSGARAGFEVLRRHQPSGPLMCMEFWCGWFGHWDAEPVVRATVDAADALREILDCGASVNLYMAHGGTNFAGWAGANRSGELHDGALQPTVTSYDYDAPIDEYGRPTEKFWLFRDILALHQDDDAPIPDVPPTPAPLAGPAAARLCQWAPLGDVLEVLGGAETETAMPPTFEELGVDRGLVRYRVRLPGPRQAYPLGVTGLRDLAVVYVDGARAGVLNGAAGGADAYTALAAPVEGPAVVELWVESLGRVNYGPRLAESKGISGGVLHERQYVHGVRARGLRLDAFDDPESVGRVPFREAGEAVGAAGLYRGAFDVRGAGDAGLELRGFTRGFVWVNGFCLGRYWSVGPQRSLYVPGPVLREGANEVWVLEVYGAEAGALTVRLG
ncbi:beta-galactosidase [Streptomyces sp. H27-C3]|uniref:glycoside hydrolase family 35 protein n=1 Tax=Streptomyces sp. H27-C3 TaxID=3046305 RepID=UPI0024B8EE10|nr:beta-galactosidase [Streptomyces sp. H27-C3]MDJ0461225.1 beta-galactosidase [Streptomyces sp. H27-C3]